MIDKKDNKWTLFILLGIILLGVVLRLYNLTAKALWYDEISTISIAEKSLGFILQPFSSYKSAFVILLKIWIGIFGTSIFATRLLPALFGIVSIFLTFRIGKDLFNSRVGLIASFLFSTSSFHIYHSQQVKQYTVLLFLVLLSTFYFVKFIAEGKTRFILPNVLLNILILYTHPFGFAVILFQALYTIVNYKLIERAELKKWFLYQTPLLFSLCIWVSIIYSTEKYFKAILWWVRLPNIHSLTDTFRTFSYGFNYGLSDVNMQLCPPVISGMLSIIFGLLFIKGLFNAFGYYRQSHVKLTIAWLFLPIVLIISFSYLIRPVYVTKHLLILLPAFYYIVAIGLSHKTRTFFIITILAVIFGLNSIPLRRMHDTVTNVDWQKAVQLMERHSLKDNAVIIMATTKEVVCLIYYLNHADNQALRDIDIFGKVTDSGWQESFQYKKHYIITLGSELEQTQDAYYDPGSGINKIYKPGHIIADFDKKILGGDILKAEKQVWLLVSRWAGDEYRLESIAQKLKAYFKMAFRKEVSGVKVYRFEPM